MRQSHRFASADELQAVSLPSVRVAGGGVASASALGWLLLLAEGPADVRAVLVHVGLLLGTAVIGVQHQDLVGQADAAAEVLALQGVVVAVGLGDVETPSCLRPRRA